MKSNTEDIVRTAIWVSVLLIFAAIMVSWVVLMVRYGSNPKETPTKLHEQTQTCECRCIVEQQDFPLQSKPEMP